MNSTGKPQNSGTNNFLWVIVIALVIVGIVANYYFNSVTWSLRLSGWIVLTVVITLLGFKTANGKKLWNFAKEARIELRKVVWSTKDETIRNTMIIAALVVFTSLILWCVDTLLLMAVNWLSG